MAASIFLLALAVSVSPDAKPADAASAEPKRYHTYSLEMKTALRAEALAKTQGQRGNAILALTNLYAELRNDARFESSEVLQNMKNKLWSRLTHVREDLKRTLARQAEAAKREAARKEKLSRRASSAKTKPSARQRADRGGGIIPDFGQALVELIERTIAPGKWDVNGGPFSIVYFAPRRVLVVSASDEFHHNLNGVLKAMRAAGP